MLKRVGLFLCDLSAVAIATLLALLLRDNFETSLAQIVTFVPYLGTTVAVAAVVLVVMGLNQRVWWLSVMSDYLRIVAAAILTVSVAMAIGFLTDRLEKVARALPIIEFILIVFSLVGMRVTARLIYAQIVRARGSVPLVPDFARDIDTVLLVGVNRLTNFYLRSLDDVGDGTVRIGGILASDKSYHGRTIGAHRVLDAPTNATEVIRTLAVHGVFVTRIVVMAHPRDLPEAEREGLAHAALTHQIPLEYLPETLGFGRAPATKLPENTHPFTTLGDHKEVLWLYARRPYWVVKRVVDIVVATALVVLLAPLIALVAAVTAFDVGTPIIFWQERPGRRNVPIRVYKFRTMGKAYDADGRKLSDAERISRLGAFLRAIRLDELPQLFNVIFGHMSFVGPRPLLPVDQFPGLEARLAVPPGITGWAQVNGGRDVSAQDKAAMDIWYLRHASFWIDLKICLLTVRMILVGERPNPSAIAAAWRDLESLPSPRTNAAMAQTDAPSAPQSQLAGNVVPIQKLVLVR